MNRGFCANDESNNAVNQFRPECIVISWGSWLANPLLNYSDTQIIVLFEDEDVNFQKNTINIALVHSLRTVVKIVDNQEITLPPLWCLLREPDLVYPNVQDGVNKANSDKDLILSAVPSAKFILSTGTGKNPPYKDGSYGRQLLAGMTMPKKIKYLGFTFYPDPAYPAFGKFVNKMEDWGIETEKGLVALEYGIPNNLIPAPISEGLPFTYTNATNYMQGVVDYASWYAQRAINDTKAVGYRCLLDNNGNLTATGQEWNNY